MVDAQGVQSSLGILLKRQQVCAVRFVVDLKLIVITYSPAFGGCSWFSKNYWCMHTCIYYLSVSGQNRIWGSSGVAVGVLLFPTLHCRTNINFGERQSRNEGITESLRPLFPYHRSSQVRIDLLIMTSKKGNSKHHLCQSVVWGSEESINTGSLKRAILSVQSSWWAGSKVDEGYCDSDGSLSCLAKLLTCHSPYSIISAYLTWQWYVPRCVPLQPLNR